MRGGFLGGSAVVEIMPGSHIDQAAADAVSLAKLIRGRVHFNFNEVAIVANSESTEKEVADQYNSRLEYERLKEKAMQSVGKDDESRK